MLPANKISVAILDDHQGIIDGYMFRLQKNPRIEVVATLEYGENLEPALKEHPVDVLILDIFVPTSPENEHPYPIMHMIPKLLQMYPQMNILVISMYTERGLIRGVMDAGASGYILKDDRVLISDLANVVQMVAGGSICFSQKAHQAYRNQQIRDGENLSPRQLEAISLCASYPNEQTAQLARRMDVSNSTIRNLLSAAYTKLGVRNRPAAVEKAQSLGIITQKDIPQWGEPAQSEKLPGSMIS